jgi:hypothetical protein
MMRKFLLAVPVVAAVSAATAIAAQAMTITLGQPSLSARVAITVPVTVSCAPPSDPSLPLSSAGVSVSVEQAAGKQIAHGVTSLNFMGGPVPPPFTCDGTNQTLNVTVLADPSGAPFHGGQAVVSASAFASFGFIEGQSASVGPTALHLH